MKTLIKGLVLLAVLSLGAAAFADVTVGTFDNGNCYPFLCNDSGTNTGVSIDWQDAYSKAAFPGQITITNLEFYYAAQFGGGSTMIGGHYDFYLGYSANPFNNLSSNQVANRGNGYSLVASVDVNANNPGCNFNPVCTINVAPFTYNPANGDLLLEVIVTNQDNIPNGSGNGYNEADDTGAFIGRTYCLGASDCQSATVDTFGLVTTFSTGSQVPEPGTLVMLGTGVLGLAGAIRRKLF